MQKATFVESEPQTSTASGTAKAIRQSDYLGPEEHLSNPVVAPTGNGRVDVATQAAGAPSPNPDTGGCEKPSAGRKPKRTVRRFKIYSSISLVASLTTMAVAGVQLASWMGFVITPEMVTSLIVTSTVTVATLPLGVAIWILAIEGGRWFFK